MMKAFLLNQANLWRVFKVSRFCLGENLHVDADNSLNMQKMAELLPKN